MTLQVQEKEFLKVFLSRMLLQTLGYNRLEWQIGESDEYDLSLFTANGEPWSNSEFIPGSRSYRLITAVEEIFSNLDILDFEYTIPKVDCTAHDFYEQETKNLVHSLVNLV